VCVCVCVRARACVCVCVCARANSQRSSHIVRLPSPLCVCVCTYFKDTHIYVYSSYLDVNVLDGGVRENMGLQTALLEGARAHSSSNIF